MDRTMMLLCCIFCIFCGYTTARKGAGSVGSVTYDVNTDSSLTLRCLTHFSGSDSEIDQCWVFQGNILTMNTDIKAKVPSRYNVKYQKNGHNRLYTLTISNPVQKDEGSYKCRIDYKWQGTYYSTSKYVGVTINFYLPPPKYPLCIVRPSRTLNNGNFAKFECEVGETNAQITLNVTLQLDNGSLIHLGDVLNRSLSVIRTVTLRDNNSMFICQMTSSTYPTTYRNCSAGPLIISASTSTKQPEKLTTEASQPPQNLTTTETLTLTSQPKTSSRKFTTETYHSNSTSESDPSSTTKPKLNYSNRIERRKFNLTLVGCAIGILFLSLLIIICGVIYQRRTSKDTCTVTPSSAKPRRYRKRYEPQPSTVAGQPSSQDTGPNQIPLYAIVHQTNSDNENLLDTKTYKTTEMDIYEDIDLPAQDNSSESMSNTKTLGARAMATSTGKNEDVKLLADNQTTRSDDYEDVELPGRHQNTTSGEYDDVKLQVRSQTTTSGESDDVKLPADNQTNTSREYDDVKLPVCSQTTASGEYDDVKLPVYNQTTASDEYDEVKLPVHNQTTASGEYDDVKPPVRSQTTASDEYDGVKLLVPNETSTIDEYKPVKIPVGIPNQTTIKECEDDDLPAPDELKGFSMDSLNNPRTEVMHYQDTNITPGQSPFYVSIQPNNPSDENMSDNGVHETVDEYEDVNF